MPKELINLFDYYNLNFPNFYGTPKEREVFQEARRLFVKAKKELQVSDAKIFNLILKYKTRKASRYPFITALRYGKDWRIVKSHVYRQSIRDRDKNKCKTCGAPAKDGLRLDIHHIGSPTSQSKENLISLCKRCHIREEKFKRTNRRLSIKKLKSLINK